MQGLIGLNKKLLADLSQRYLLESGTGFDRRSLDLALWTFGISVSGPGHFMLASSAYARENVNLCKNCGSCCYRKYKAKKVHDIVKTQSVPVIDCLLVEVFSRILYFVLSVTHDRACDLHRLQKQKFAGVSRWREVVLNTQSLWTSIRVCPRWPSSFVEMHMTRSREHPLDSTVLEWWQ
ncbi:hypothetical protein EDC04DRAFT_854290 [Pisolithus marmoratus]|nr:hypothetical protein EDC04DRAFT_854290 [Pisolithus marmoratus]